MTNFATTEVSAGNAEAGHISGCLAPAILAALPAPVYTIDLEGRITSYNPAAADLWGRHPVLHQDRWSGAWRLYRPDGTPMAHDESPIAVALGQGRAIRNAEAVAERPDGTRVPFLANPTPLRNDQGDIVGMANLLVDVTEARRAALTEHHFASIVESSHDAIISKDINGIIATWNPGAENLFGYTAAEAVGRHVNLLIPEDRLDEEPRIIDRIRRGERVDHFETIRRRKDGSLVDISLTISPVRDEQGRIVGASKIARDISERRRSEEQQGLILREMSHRVKNLFSVAASLVTMSARASTTPEEMAESVRARLNALTKAHELTRPGLLDIDTAMTNTTLAELLRAIFEPYARESVGQYGSIQLSGPEVLLGGNAVTSFALVFHELATNAAKYGALSDLGGRIRVNWHMTERRLLVSWQEAGGPSVPGPARHRGFGSTLSQRLISGQFDGKIDYDWRPEGLAIHIDVELSRLGWKGPG
ncbi:PAS domain S-box protein [Mesorhizobium sp. BR1-1-16]|uniref:PAS domain S-box protein n=1 Tax=Mesorhizobium sp. BR1-1-16 TaxID=2876653 RepID=UPI001CCCC492|nr:PAS domain S-box protein [Mesorhizobium sp. BR1-1-16]MBZ9936621.1 PAS domain S-box protein [Mesorhizobium sp. BR1-1-16]